MSANEPVARIARRELHPSRALASVLAASALIIAFLWAAAETVLAALGRRPLLASPRQIAHWAAAVPAGTTPAVLIAAGAALAVTGLVLILLGVLPGSRARHRLSGERAAVVVDDDVIAAALSRTAHQRARTAPEQVTATVGRRRIDLVIRPTSGVPVDEAGIREAVDAELARYGLDPPPRLFLRSRGQGAVGV
ncbi:DUF6286 domain-containing protein [Arthrobacter sp. ZGTC131]|uniref:DUF6286 domain-containing protein n=1 Tax=Arthrobacter sp. ZGTC131 TaxID=2058898 RepID=UPI000CE32F1F|nr:DUF6286 domain-containing protein [Arthrobacter sp. ZGTC131]